MADVCQPGAGPDVGLTARTLIPVPPERVWSALTEATEVSRWWSEARIDLPGGVFELWGKGVPHAPAEPVTSLLNYTESSELSIGWRMYDVDTAATISLEQVEGGTAVTVRHSGIAHSDLLINMLENLRLHCLGQQPQPYDFSRGGEKIDPVMEFADSPERVFEALLDEQTMDRYWSSGAKIEPHVGGKFDYGWGAGPLKILELEQGQRLRISWWESETSPETVVTWQLEPRGSGTRLTLTHTGFASDADLEHLDIGWFGFLLALKALLELGEQWQQVQLKSFRAEREEVAG